MSKAETIVAHLRNAEDCLNSALLATGPGEKQKLVNAQMAVQSAITDWEGR